MKNILVLADIHQKIALLPLIDKFLNKNSIDCILVLGDLTDRNEQAIIFAHNFYKVIKKHSLELIYIHGNNEPQEVIDFFNNKNCSVHNKIKKFGGMNFIGIGGWGDDIKLETLDNIKGSFFVTHIPPIKILDNKNIVNAPLVHAFGHSHMSEYAKKVGKTMYLSLKSAAFYRRAAIVTVPSLKTQFVSL